MPPTPALPTTASSLQRVPDLDALTLAFDGFIYICSQDRRIQYMNDKLRERTGYDATGELCYKILHGREELCPWCNNDQLFREQKTLRRQFKSPKDERWYDVINTPIRNSDGTISKQSLLMDITETHLAKEELSLFQTLINQSNDAIFVIDADTSAFIYVNDKACSSLGYSTTDLLALRVIDISTNFMDMPNWLRHAARIREQNRLFEAGHIRKDGSHIPVEITASFVPRREKNFIVSVARDISERQTQTQALLEERNKLESLFATLSDGITVQDTDFKVLYQNKVHMDKQGVHTGEYCYQAYQHRTTICDGCLLVQSFADGKVHRRETTATGEHGLIHLEVTSSPMKDAAGNIIAGIESVRDITAQKKLEEQLSQAQKMEAIGTLAGGIAHDFNNILTPILGYSELALTRITPDNTLTSDLHQITRAALRARDLIQQILAFSRRQAPQERKPLQPYLVIKEALKLLRASLPTTIEIREDISTNCGAIVADPTQLHQIIMNLCTNAYHAMRESGGILGVRLSQTSIAKGDGKIGSFELTPGNYIQLEISDTGYGMERKTLERIFEPYFTTKAKGEGTGLGLSIVHGIVKSYQGQITVDSEPGKGTCFHVYLPLMAEAPTLGESVLTSPLPTGSERLLVVDDEEAITTMFETILTHLGYQITVINNSQMTLALIEQDPMAFDLLLTDMTMPHLTGFELAQKALAIRADLPVILCTGFSELVNKEQAQALGIRAYLMKPVSVQELSQTVRKVLDAKRE
ncbi:MAG: PAS domain S-box protein [Deltaproteobacteria bacterium]|nr:PAS domain S-box protein [Deltaproteobacteria bacterium]